MSEDKAPDDGYRSLPTLLDFLTGVLLLLWLFKLAPVEPIMVSIAASLTVSLWLRIKHRREDKQREPDP